MALSKEQKKKLEGILETISSPEERASIETLKTKEMITEKDLENKGIFAKLESKIEDFMSIIEGYKNSISKSNQKQNEGMGKFVDVLVEKLDELGNAITTSYVKNKPESSAGVYKDMINQLSSIDKSIKDKPVPVWNWPQYASVGVRNKSFSNINPATDGLGLGDFDYVECTYTGNNPTTIIYKQGGASGTVVATLDITYNGSNVETITKS